MSYASDQPSVDLSEFEGPTVSTNKCKVGRIIDELDADRKQKLTVALTKKDEADSPTYTVSAERIVTALSGWGFSVRETTVKTHRRGVCACAR